LVLGLVILRCDFPLPVLEHLVGHALISSSHLVLLPFYSSEKFLMIFVRFVKKVDEAQVGV
jgi:hypothetical protein